MKKLFLSLVISSALFVIGCQENAITDPLSTDSPEFKAATNETAIKNLTPDFSDVPNVIRFQNLLGSPYLNAVGEFFMVDGSIRYDHKVNQLDPIPPSPQYRVAVNISLNAEMTSKRDDGNRWTIWGNTEDIFYFSGDEAHTLMKYFRVEGRSDRMQLVCKFEVTLKGIVLKAMWLRLAKDKPVKVSIDY